MATPAGVTLEKCGDVKAEEVQAALAIEYQEEEFGHTMLTVQCRGEAATLRITGPNHPSGRIVDVDLAGIAPGARPRTIAVLAAELWTAPEPSPATPPGLQVALAIQERDAVPAKPRFGPSYRSDLTVGVNVIQMHRSFYAGRDDGRYGANGNFTAIGFKADWPVFRWLGVFTGASVSSETSMAGHGELRAPVRWRRSETGFYVPIRHKQFRLDLQYSGGLDTVTAQGVNVRNSERIILPRYTFSSFTANMAYVVNQKTNVTAWAATYRAKSTDDEYTSLSGSRWGLGTHYQVKKNLRADARLETASLGGDNYFTSNSYSDQATTLGLSLSWVR
jgi:hypothetical protein